MFIFFARDFGLKGAIQRAARLGWQYQQPLQALLAMWHESAQNCNAQSAKRYQLTCQGAK